MTLRLSPTLDGAAAPSTALPPGPARTPRPVLAAVVAVLVSMAGALTSGSAWAQEAAIGDPEAGKQKAYTCLGCHGVEHYVNVYPSYHVPLIAGQHAEYIAVALQAYRSGVRKHPTMQSNAAPLSDQDIADIASWLSSFAPSSP